MASPGMQSVLANAELALEHLAEQSQIETITLLSEKFGFDENEAQEFLKKNSVDGTSKSKSKTKFAKSKSKSKGSPKTHSLESDPVLHAKPKRAPSGYMLYSSHVRPQVVTNLTNNLAEGDKLKGPDIMKGIAVMWKLLTDSERAAWNLKAKNVVAD